MRGDEARLRGHGGPPLGQGEAHPHEPPGEQGEQGPRHQAGRPQYPHIHDLLRGQAHRCHHRGTDPGGDGVRAGGPHQGQRLVPQVHAHRVKPNSTGRRMYSLMSVLVTGGAGRLGYEVSRLLMGDGFGVRAFDLPGVQWSHVEALGVEAFKGDITDPISVGDALEGVSTVVHLAALLPPRSEASREATTRVNVGGTGNLLKAMIPGAHMVLASSISTHGWTARAE